MSARQLFPLSEHIHRTTRCELPPYCYAEGVVQGLGTVLSVCHELHTPSATRTVRHLIFPFLPFSSFRSVVRIIDEPKYLAAVTVNPDLTFFYFSTQSIQVILLTCFPVVLDSSSVLFPSPLTGQNSLSCSWS